MCVYPIFSGEIFRERNYQNVCLYGGKCIREWWLCELTDHFWAGLSQIIFGPVCLKLLGFGQTGYRQHYRLSKVE